MKLVIEQGYALAEAARNLGIHESPRMEKQKFAREADEEQELTEDERMEGVGTAERRTNGCGWSVTS
ncbi:MAG: hypothetical protein R3C02_07765 [Planctomycetaceae bacterium]